MRKRGFFARYFGAAGTSLAVFAVFAQILFAIAIPRVAAADDFGLPILCSGHVADEASGQTGDSPPGAKHCPQCQAVWADKILPVDRTACVANIARAAVVVHFALHGAPGIVPLPAMPPPPRGPPSIA